GGGGQQGSGTTAAAALQARAAPVPAGGGASSMRGGGPALALAQDQALAAFPTFGQVVELIRAQRDVKLLVEVETCLRLAAYRPGRIEFTPTGDAPADLAQRLGQRLQLWTGQRWAVSVTSGCEALTIAETRSAEADSLRAQAAQHPLVQAVFATFPQATIRDIRTAEAAEAQAQAEALPEVEDEWDPFEDD
ncbi:MAG: DNA polymerase III subunit gamma/tau, partial [Paracoccaceae bacterium]